MNEHLIAMVNDVQIRASAEVLDEDAAFTFARAFGTLSKRRGLPRCVFVVGFDDAASSQKLRGSLISGLIMAGHDVKDIGITSALNHEAMQNILNATAGIRVSTHSALEPQSPEAPGDEATLRNVISASERSLEVYMSGGPLVGKALQQVCDVLESGAFSSGTGTLELIDTPKRIADEGDLPRSDTVVVGLAHA